jgi:hypothetical protein
MQRWARRPPRNAERLLCPTAALVPRCGRARLLLPRASQPLFCQPHMGRTCPPFQAHVPPLSSPTCARSLGASSGSRGVSASSTAPTTS